ARDEPDRLDVAVLRYRVARNGGRAELARQRGWAVLDHLGTGRDGIELQREVLGELDRAGFGPPVDMHLALARRWLEAGALDAAESALTGVASAAGQEVAGAAEHAAAHARL